MTVSKDDIRELRAKIDENHKEVTKPLTDVAVQLGKVATALEHNSEASKILLAKTDSLESRLTTVEAKQEFYSKWTGRAIIPLLGLLGAAVSAQAIMLWVNTHPMPVVIEQKK